MVQEPFLPFTGGNGVGIFLDRHLMSILLKRDMCERRDRPLDLRPVLACDSGQNAG